MANYFCFTDQPPAYPSNDKPPAYHDVCPRKTVTPPPVDISAAPNNTPAADHIPSPEITPRPEVHFPPSNNVNEVHIPITTITTDTSSARNANTVITGYPPGNIIVTQPSTFNSLYYRQLKVSVGVCI